MCQAGDLRRALASAERLCILLGDEAYFEWRDVAVLYLHAGNLPAALAHLDAYASTPAAKGKTLSFDIPRLHMPIYVMPNLCLLDFIQKQSGVCL